MTPDQLRARRVQLGLSIDELALALEVDAAEWRRIEVGEADDSCSRTLAEAFERFEEKFFLSFASV